MLLLFFLSSGLFLGWSLGANDASNIFGAAVSTRMVKFRTAAIIASIFVIIGAVMSGSGASHTLGKLGSVNMIAGSFVVALSAGVTLLLMTRLGIPVSASQAIVGAIIGWNFFTGTVTDWGTLLEIFVSWITGPILAAILAYIIYKLLRAFTNSVGLHLFRLDAYTRLGLILVGAFGAYSLGANNIANVMGVFVPVSPFSSINLSELGTFTNTQQLFLLGGIAIAVGIFTYSKKVMQTVGSEILHLTPQAAFVVVLAESLVLFLFASRSLHDWLIAHGLPAIPLVPISSSQAVIGAVIGIGLAHGGRNIRIKVLGKIASGWITTPLLATLLSFLTLFIIQNVFDQDVYHPVRYELNQEVKVRLANEDVLVPESLTGNYKNGRQLSRALARSKFENDKIDVIFRFAEVYHMKIIVDEKFLSRIRGWFTDEQVRYLTKLDGWQYNYKWQLEETLSEESIVLKPDQLEYIYRSFRLE